MREEEERALLARSMAAQEDASFFLWATEEKMTYQKTPIARHVVARTGWLIIFMAGLLLCASVMQWFEALLKDRVQLTFFVPLLIGHAGNSGGQTVTTVIREIGCGNLARRDARTVVAKEAAVGCVQSLILVVGMLPYMVVTRVPSNVVLVVYVSMVVLGVLANALGSLLPFLITRVNRDPAVIVAPLMTTVVDTLGIAVYLSIAMAVVPHLEGAPPSNATSS